MGKGDRYRPVDRKKWDEAWDRLLKAKKQKGTRGKGDRVSTSK